MCKYPSFFGFSLLILVLCGKILQRCGGCGSRRIIQIHTTASCQMPCVYHIILTKNCHWIFSKLSVGGVRICINFEKHIAKQKRELHLCNSNLNVQYFSKTLIDLNHWKWSIRTVFCCYCVMWFRPVLLSTWPWLLQFAQQDFSLNNAHHNANLPAANANHSVWLLQAFAPGTYTFSHKVNWYGYYFTTWMQSRYAFSEVKLTGEKSKNAALVASFQLPDKRNFAGIV